MEMLTCTGVGPRTRDIIYDIYTNSTMYVSTANTTSDLIQFHRGVKQGCPLSPILFNFVMEPLIRALDSIPSGHYAIGNQKINPLTYTDDLCVLAQSPVEMQRMLNALQSASRWAGLTFNAKKCGTLTLSRAGRQFAETFSPKMNGDTIPSMTWEDHYKYLECKAGADHRTEATKQGEEYLKCCRIIVECGLADWQKLMPFTALLSQGLYTFYKTPYPINHGHRG